MKLDYISALFMLPENDARVQRFNTRLVRQVIFKGSQCKIVLPAAFTAHLDTEARARINYEYFQTAQTKQ